MQLLQDFIKDCQTRRRSKRTLETYKSNVGEYLQYFPDPADVDKNNLRHYLGYLQNRGLKDSTLKGYFSALSSFYDFLIYEEVTHTNPILPFRQRYLDKPTKNERRQLLTIEDMRRLIGSVENIRNIAMLITLAKHGPRLEEFRQLNRESIDMERKQIIYPQKAKRNNRILPMDQEHYDIMKKYLEWRDLKTKNNALWISSRGGRIHRDDTNKIIADYARPLGLHDSRGPLERKLTSHCFRKWLTHHLYSQGARDVTIKIIRGDSLQKQAWTSNYLEPDILTEEVTAEYFRYVPELL